MVTEQAMVMNMERNITNIGKYNENISYTSYMGSI